jgi:D-sedoheptulose 7-phosphate isomerase
MSFISDYLNEVELIAKNLDKVKIEEIIEVLVRLKSVKGRLFILGVGGSAGNAGHAVNDFRKLASIEAYSPTDNIAEVTARTNDEGFETIFTGYLSVSKLKSEDCILILSVGGGDLDKNISRNLCLAIDFAKSKNSTVIGIVGKKEGYTAMQADICLVIPQVNSLHITPHSESFQALIWHLMVSHPKLQENSTKW